MEKYKENPTVVNGGIAAVAVAGASVFLLSEVEAILQVQPPLPLYDKHFLPLSLILKYMEADCYSLKTTTLTDGK